MNLKESYRYANYLDNLYETAQRHLYDKAFTTTTKQNHLRKKANSDAVDEIIEVPKSYDVDYTPNDVPKRNLLLMLSLLPRPVLKST